MSPRRMRRRAQFLAAIGVAFVLGVLAFVAVLPAFADHIPPDHTLVIVPPDDTLTTVEAP